jgi:hypothetical protein
MNDSQNLFPKSHLPAGTSPQDFLMSKLSQVEAIAFHLAGLVINIVGIAPKRHTASLYYNYF